MHPIILTAASTGNKWSRDDTPYIPITSEEIIADGIAAYRAGAAMLHIHARGSDGKPTFDPAIFARILDAYKKNCPDVILQMSVGGMHGQTKKYLEPLLQLRPDIASFNFTEPEEDTLYMVEKFHQYNVKPVVECFSLEMLRGTHTMLTKGYFNGPTFIEMLFGLKDDGRDFAQMAGELLEFCRWLPEGAVWSQTRGNASHIKLQALSAALGGHLRTGFEDCISYKPGEYVKSSAELITQAAGIAQTMGRAVATPKEARAILGL